MVIFEDQVDRWGLPLLLEDFKTAEKKFLAQGAEEEAVKKTISAFKAVKDRIKDAKDRDIDQWAKKSFEEFSEFVEKLSSTKSKTASKKLAKMEGAELVAENSGWYVYKITTHEAAMLYGSNTKWCITEKDGKYWRNYYNHGDFYFYISKTDRGSESKIAAHVMPDEVIFWNANDEEYDDFPSDGEPKFRYSKRELKVEVDGKFLTLEEFSKTKGLKVGGSLSLSGTAITSLPEGLSVGGWFWLTGCTSLASLPQGLSVGRDLDLSGCTSLTSLPEGLSVGGWLSLYGCTSLTSLPEGLSVGGSLDLRGTSLASLGEGLSVGGSLDLSRCTSLASLPEGLSVGVHLNLRGCASLTSLPEGLSVKGSLWLNNTSLASLPDDLEVGGNIFVDDPAKIKCSDKLREKLK